MQKKKQIKEIILITIIVILLLLIMFLEDIIKLQNKNKIGLSENAEQELTNITNEPNVPTISAGMIPIKWDGNYWTITTKEDNTWYDYSNNQPAYIMLNDGTYQSELIRNMEGKKLAEKNIGVQIQENELGTIFVWIPRFAINDNGEEINYIKDTGTAEEGWTIPELFEYKQDETKPDYILTGTWVEKEIDTNTASKITEMNKEEGIYGFLAHTKATNITTEETKELQKYTLINTLEDITNQNRITLKIIDENKQDPIKAKGNYNKDTGIITIQVTYSQYGIKQILLERTELSFNKTNGIIADTIGIELEDGKYTITIIDNKENKKELKIQVISKIYATLYTDGTLAFGKSENPLPEKTISKKYGDISEKKYSSGSVTLWYKQRTQITKVNFANKISPISTAYWFCYLEKLITIENINNFNTSNVTNIKYMFAYCKALTELDVSNFDTSNVTDMSYMFAYCEALTELDVSNFNTSNVTDMSSMFRSCSTLTELDVSNFDTSNVTDMNAMFHSCSTLTELDVSNFDTSNVTDMSSMFRSCSTLTELDVSRFNTSNLTDMSSMFYCCSGLTQLDVSSFDTSNVIYMSSMFASCSGLTKLDVSNFDTSNVIYMDGMFRSCSNLTELDISNLNTSKVTDMAYMFYNCSSLTELDVSNFDTSNVTDMKGMFCYCNVLTELDVSNFDTSNVTDMSSMFNSCSNLTELDVSRFNTSNVTGMEYMFYCCSGLMQLDISSFDTSNVKYMEKMFYYCSNLKTIYVGAKWSTSKATTTDMFKYCGINSVTKKS